MYTHEWKHKFDLGDEVYFDGKQYFILSITASSGSESYNITYGLTISMPAPYSGGAGANKTVDEETLITKEQFVAMEIQTAKDILAKHGINV